MKEKVLVEIRTGEEPTEKVINLNEFLTQHLKTYELPLLNGGCIIVKKLGYLIRAEIDEKYLDMCEQMGVKPAFIQDLKENYTRLMDMIDRDPDNPKIKAPLEAITKEVTKYRKLIGTQSLDMLVEYIINIVEEPEELKVKSKCESWLKAMEPDEFEHVADLIGTFLGGEKKNSPVQQ